MKQCDMKWLLVLMSFEHAVQHSSSIHQHLAKVAIFYHQNLDMTLDAAARSSLTTHPGDWAPFIDVVALLSTEPFLIFSNEVS